MAMVTPPVALAAYAGASIARSCFWKTGIVACRIGIVRYILPCLFVYKSWAGLLLDASTGQIVVQFRFCLIGCAAIAGTIIGHFFGLRLRAWWRLLLLLAALTIFYPFSTLIVKLAAVVFIFSFVDGPLLNHFRAKDSSA